MTERKNPLTEEQFEALLEKDKKSAVTDLAEKIADSPDLKKIWVDSQVLGEKPLIEWENEKLKVIAKDFFEWEE